MSSDSKKEEEVATAAAADGLTITSTVTLNDGRQMPVFGLGVWKATPKDCKKAVLAALKAGYRHIDTAHLYGNEAAVGEAVRESGIPREEIWITTKVWTNELGFEESQAAGKACAKRLGFEYIDLLLIHAPDGGYVGAWKGLEQLRKEGVAKSIGVSNFGVQHIDTVIAEGSVVPAMNQVELHPMLCQKDIVKHCRSKGIHITAYAPLIRASNFDHPLIQKVAKRYPGKTPAQVLIRWSLDKGNVVIPKSVNPGRIKENAGVFGWSLSADDVAELDGADCDHHECWDPTGWDA